MNFPFTKPLFVSNQPQLHDSPSKILRKTIGGGSSNLIRFTGDQEISGNPFKMNFNNENSMEIQNIDVHRTQFNFSKNNEESFHFNPIKNKQNQSNFVSQYHPQNSAMTSQFAANSMPRQLNQNRSAYFMKQESPEMKEKKC